MSKILVTCAKAISPVLAGELRALGLPVRRELAAAVETEGTVADCMTLNLRLRTAQRVLLLVREFTARNADELYAELAGIPWEDSIPADGYFSVISAVNNPTIRDTRFASLRCKDAIADRIKDKRGRRPDSGPDHNRVVVYLHWEGEEASVYFDTSGEPLSRRGYRKSPGQAPMQETLAAAVVLSTKWDRKAPFINPMCGSGTLAIEAAMLAADVPPGALRENFGFMHLVGYEPESWTQLKTEDGRSCFALRATQDKRKTEYGGIVATDRDPQVVEAARRNAAGAGVEDLIRFSVCDYADTPVEPGGGVVVFNPEYGERMGDKKALKSVYWGIGQFLKRKCKGCTGYVFTGNPELARNIPLKPARQIPFWNSNIECRLLEFDLY